MTADADVAATGPAAHLNAVLDFLPCRTPRAWLVRAADSIELLLLDHASLELKAADQAQKLIRKYGAAGQRGRAGLTNEFRHCLLNKMSRLAREELRHFEQVLSLIEARGDVYRAVSASRYAAGLHACVRSGEPQALIDTLVVGAIIEARSCERFSSLVPVLEGTEPAIARFYGSLLRSEARHFEDYLSLARAVSPADITKRVQELLGREAELVESADAELRFHSGAPS